MSYRQERIQDKITSIWCALVADLTQGHNGWGGHQSKPDSKPSRADARIFYDETIPNRVWWWVLNEVQRESEESWTRGREKFFCSPQILKKKAEEITPDEFCEHTKAMCFLLRAGEAHYSELQEELCKRVYKSWNEYPVTIVSTYELLLCTSWHIGLMSKRQRNNRSRPGGKNIFIFVQNSKKGKSAN